MYHKLFFSITLLALCHWSNNAQGQDTKPQQYPNLPPPPVLLENDTVIAQGMPTVTSWTGAHSHEGNQLVVVLEPFTMVRLVDGNEEETSYSEGDVFWIDKGEHDHRALDVGRIVIVTVK